MKKGILVHPVNLPFDKVALTTPIAEELDAPTFLVNDCCGTVLGERRFGAGKGLDNLVYGTGIGGEQYLMVTHFWERMETLWKSATSP